MEDKEVLVIIEEDFDYYNILGVIEPHNINDFLKKVVEKLEETLNIKIEKYGHIDRTGDIFFNWSKDGRMGTYSLKTEKRIINQIYRRNTADEY